MKILLRSLGLFSCLFLVFFSTAHAQRVAQYYSWQNYSVAYTAQGRGPALVLVHSVDLGSSFEEWNEIMAGLTPHYRVYRFDFVGFGQSSKPDIVYTASLFEEQLRSFLREIVKEKAVVVASHLAAAYAVKVANDPSEPISDLVMVSPLGVTRMAHPPGAIGHLFYQVLRVPGMSRFIQRFYVSRDCLRMRFQSQFTNDLDLENYLDLSHAWIKQPEARFAMMSIISGYLNEDMSRALRHLKVPALLIMGESIPGERSVVRKFKKLNHTLRTRLVRSSRMWPQVSRPTMVNEYILQFLKRNGNHD